MIGIEAEKLFVRARLLEGIVERLSLGDRDHFILGAVNNEVGRVRFGDVKNRRGIAPDFRMGVVVAAQEFVEELRPVIVLMDGKVDRSAGVNHSLDFAGIFCERGIGIVARIDHAQQQRELSA